MAFRIGQKVVCVIAHREGDLEVTEPMAGDIATISNIGKQGRTLFLELEEFPAPESESFYAGWKASAFRPIVEKSTDAGMAVLREILDRESYVTKTPAKAG